MKYIPEATINIEIVIWISLNVLIPDMEFYEINRVERKVSVGGIYFKILLINAETVESFGESNH